MGKDTAFSASSVDMSADELGAGRSAPPIEAIPADFNVGVDAGLRTATLRGWAMREMAPWMLTGVDRAEAEKHYDDLNARFIWAAVYRFSKGDVALVPRPRAVVGSEKFEPRAGAYLRFFREVSRTLPANYEAVFCMTLDDRPPDQGSAPVFSFQKPQGTKTPLLPDIDFLESGFYADKRFLDVTDYADKTRKAVFAGSTTGGIITETIARNLSSPRLRSAKFFQDHARVDFRLPLIAQVASEEARALLAAMSFCNKPFLAWKDQLHNRFILSMDGNGATCSRVAIGLMSNSVLVKYDSDHILYYFDGMRPWVHYVPVARDSEVEAVIDLEARDPASFAAIAAAGRRFAAAYLSRDAVVEYMRLLLIFYAQSFSTAQGTRIGEAPSAS